MSNGTSIQKLLRGCRVMTDPGGRMIVQTVLNMKLVCLTTDDEFSHDKFSNPMDVIGSNKQYGQMWLKNPDAGKPTIVPAQIAVLTKQSAQDHGMVKAAYIRASEQKSFTDAGCVQGSQGGTISADKDMQTVRFLPLGARELVFQKIGKTGDLSNIYAAIEKAGNAVGISSGRYLVEYFRQLDDRLTTFISHFERPQRCIGVIVMIGDEVVAIDRFPSFVYCAQIWDALVRDCYGSAALVQAKKGEKVNAGIRKHLKKRGSAANRLRDALEARKKAEDKIVKERVEEIFEVEFSERQDTESSGDGYVSRVLTAEGYIGQAISEGGFEHLVSIVKKDAFTPEVMRKAQEMRNKTRKQEDFRL